MKRRSVLFGAAASGAVLSAGGAAEAAWCPAPARIDYDWGAPDGRMPSGYSVHTREATIVIGHKPEGYWGLAYFHVKAECTSRVEIHTPNSTAILHMKPRSVATVDYFDGNVAVASVRPRLETEVLTGAVLEWARGDFTDGTPKKWIEVR
jgi:hypothetical protein